MPSDFVYLISCYDEHGSENVLATLDAARVPDLVAHFEKAQRRELPQERKKLAEVLSLGPLKTDLGVNGRNLSDGWGGLMLHIVPLEK